METIEYRDETLDKSDWGEGPWQHEPDKVQWMDEKTGLPCLIKRGPMGVWCGYVGVPRSHPAFEKGYDDVDVEVHGGLTYAGLCQPHDEGDEAHAICHVVEDGEDDNVYWLGFDCGHGWDFLPRMAATNRRLYKETGEELWNDLNKNFRDETYRDQEYVTRETLELARQLKEAA